MLLCVQLSMSLFKKLLLLVNVMTIQYINIIMDLTKHFQQLLDDHWTFLNAGWPTITPRNNHRTVSKEIRFMPEIKETLNRRLGPIPVYFFLVDIWPKVKYPGPYKEVEKGLLML
jgi:hypothetical protein